MSNFLEALEKVAAGIEDEQMNPDNHPGPTEDEVAETQIHNEDEVLQDGDGVTEEKVIEEAIAEELAEQEALEQARMQAAAVQEDGGEQAAEQLPEIAPEEAAIVEGLGEEQVAYDIREALTKEAAAETLWLATIAKVAQCARGGQGIPDGLQKEAHEILEVMLESEESFGTEMERVASELFGTQENVDALFTPEGMHMVFEQLAALEQEGLDKQADEEINALVRLKNFASEAIQGATEKVVGATKSALNVEKIKAEMQGLEPQLQQFKNTAGAGGWQLEEHLSPEKIDEYGDMQKNYNALGQQKATGQKVRAVGGGALAAGAIYGGKKLYDHMHEGDEEKIAAVLPDENPNGTLNSANENETNGGIQKMANKQIVTDFLKVAGAAGLVSIAGDENQPEEMRKEASEAFDTIALMGREEMDNQLVKVAQQIYTEDELHEIVAGHHTDTLTEKVAYFVDAADQSYDEVFEKTANAGGVAAVKNMGAGLKDAASNIANVIKDKKIAAEGAGRDYIGALKGGAPYSKGVAQAGTATGLAGGGLVGAGAMAGYNAIKNPSEYNIEQTAEAFEEAVLAKQAALETFHAADSFIQSYGHIFNNNK